jgi:predicted  nucleic acid-binding Zn-ribbon protein
VQDYLFKAEEKLLDLKFEKETHDLQYSRLQKRIQELEQYKNSSSKVSANIKANQEADQAEIDEIAGRSTQDKKKKESVRVRTAPSKGIGELEMLVESLKRVIEKQKTEADALKKIISKTSGQVDKVASEKALR